MVTRHRRRTGNAPGPRPGGRWILLVAVAFGAAAFGWWWAARPVAKPTREQIRGVPGTAGSVERPERPSRSEEPVGVPEGGGEKLPPLPTIPGPPEPVGNLALLIDDLGRSIAELEALDALGIPVSWAVLPFESQTDEVVAWLAREPREVLCHLPMEASNGADPGPGALTAAMSLRELAGSTRRALARVPTAVGVNNHMGSELTADRRALTAVLEVVRERDLFFVDSRTSAHTVGYELAREMGIPATERQVFLDADGTVEGVREQLERWKAIARERGAAVAIAHPRASTLQVLREEIPRAQEEGFVFVPVSFLLDRSGAPQ